MKRARALRKYAKATPCQDGYYITITEAFGADSGEDAVLLLEKLGFRVDPISSAEGIYNADTKEVTNIEQL